MADKKVHAGLTDLDGGTPLQETLHDNGDGTFARVVYTSSNAVGQKSATVTLQGAPTSASDLAHGVVAATANGAADSADGYETQILLIDNGVGTCTVNVEGSLDAAFTNTQQNVLLGVVLESTSTAAGVQTTNVSRSVVSGAIAVAANTSYAYSIYDVLPNTRARISAGSGLGTGTAATGCTVRLYKLAV